MIQSLEIWLTILYQLYMYSIYLLCRIKQQLSAASKFDVYIMVAPGMNYRGFEV